jgi:GWxTD domain-containing protein
MKALILLLVILSLNINAQVETSKGQSPFRSNPLFYYDIGNYKGSSDSLTRVDIFLQVPYSRIQFIKSGAGYNASYTVDLSFKNFDSEESVLEKSWREKVNTAKYESTSSNKNFNISYRSFKMPPGKYKVSIEVEDDDSKINRKVVFSVSVMDFSAPFTLSDIMFVSRQLKNSRKVVPNVSHNITNSDIGLSFFFNIYSDTSRSAEIVYRINNKSNEKLFSQKIDKELKPGKNLIYQTLDNKSLSLGEYSLIVQVKDKNSDEKIGIGKKFHSKIFSFPTSVVDLDLAVNQLIYIAAGSDIDFINDARTYSEKLSRFISYWKSKDPSPNTEENEILNEYYRRIDYSNAHFKSYYPGWRTDMGMIYVTLGPPSQVERHPFEYGSKPYEIWEYLDLNRRFIFVDQTGFGDYRLLNPDYGDLYRYRY